MAKRRISRVSESFYVDRELVTYSMVGHVEEKTNKYRLDSEGVLISNDFEFTIWKSDGYVPVLGDLVYYKDLHLVLKGFIDDSDGFHQTLICTYVDFNISITVLNGYILNILRRTQNLVDAEDGDIVHHIVGGSVSNDINYNLMATFFTTNGSEANSYIQYEKVDNNSIRLIMQPGTFFTGTVTIERR